MIRFFFLSSRYFLVAVICAAFCTTSQAQLKKIHISENLKAPARVLTEGNWVYAHSSKESSEVRTLIDIKNLIAKDDAFGCLDKGHSLSQSTKNPELALWIFRAQIQCGLMALKKKKSFNKNLEALAFEFERLKFPSYEHPAAEMVRKLFSQYLAQVIEAAFQKKPREIGALIDLGLHHRTVLAKGDLAVVYKYAGELAVLDQNLEKAISYLRQSLREDDRGDVRSRLEIVTDLQRTQNKTALVPSSAAKGSAKETLSWISNGERELDSRITQSLASGNTLAFVEDGVKYLKEFPSGVRANSLTEKLFDTLMSTVGQDQSEIQVQFFKKKLLSFLSEVDPERLWKWTQALFRSGYYEETWIFGQKLLDSRPYEQLTSRQVITVAKSAFYVGEFKVSRKLLEKFIEKYSGSDEVSEAFFLLALCHFRSEEFSAAIASLEKAQQLPLSDSQRSRNLYWLGRALQKEKSEKSAAVFDQLIKDSPFSYYGLRARAETQGAKFALSISSGKAPQTILYLTPRQSTSLKTIETLIQSGWLEEVYAELERITSVGSASEAYAFARLWWAAQGYSRAINLLSRAMDEDESYRVVEVFKFFYPRVYESNIEGETKKYQLEPHLVRSLIRQESGFSNAALSRTGAQGLMQLMPRTAAEMADLSGFKKSQSIVDLQNPQTNIQLGTYYFQRLMKQFDQNVPASLAAYNSGPTRLKRWFAQRKIKLVASSDAWDELWTEELPWEETQGYVKSVLRNLIMYRLLDGRPVLLKNPLWAAESTK